MRVRKVKMIKTTKHWVLEFNYSDSLVEIYEQCTAELIVYGKYPITMFVLKEDKDVLIKPWMPEFVGGLLDCKTVEEINRYSDNFKKIKG